MEKFHESATEKTKEQIEKDVIEQTLTSTFDELLAKEEEGHVLARDLFTENVIRAALEKEAFDMTGLTIELDSNKIATRDTYWPRPDMPIGDAFYAVNVKITRGDRVIFDKDFHHPYPDYQY